MSAAERMNLLAVLPLAVVYETVEFHPELPDDEIS
jgi:hypothetical protein